MIPNNQISTTKISVAPVTMAVPEMERTECSNIFLNGQPIPCVRELNLKQRYGDTVLDLSLQLPCTAKVEYKEGTYYITTKEPVRLSKAQLRKLIIDNIDDNLEAVALVNEFKLSEECPKETQ